LQGDDSFDAFSYNWNGLQKMVKKEMQDKMVFIDADGKQKDF
jgi:hypothetical protein